MKFLLSIIFIALAFGCAQTGLREIAAIEREQHVELWTKSLKQHDGEGLKLSQDGLEKLYLTSIDEEDFMEHLLKINPAVSLQKEEDYHKLAVDFLKLRQTILKQKKNKKSQTVSTLLVILAEKVEETSKHKFGK